MDSHSRFGFGIGFLISWLALVGLSLGQESSGQLRVSRELRLDYLIQVPDGYSLPENVGEKWPLVVFLHGSGERGSDLELVKKHGPPKLIAAGRKFPAIVVSPQCPEGSWWMNQPVLELIDHIETGFRIDADRVYLTGLSMGGYGTWHFVSFAPERFAAVVPVCGGGIPYLMRLLKNMPVWAFHGQLDDAVPVAESEMQVTALQKAGNTQVKFTVYPDLAHDCWTAAYETEELWDWLFAQSRKSLGGPAQ